jgi:hypothetical protein
MSSGYPRRRHARMRDRVLLCIMLLLISYVCFFMMPVEAQVQPQPAPINIDFQCESGTFSKVNIVPTSVGDIRVLGRITNNSTQTLEGIIVVSEFYDRSGRLIEVSDVYPSLNILNPNDTAPFRAEPLDTKVNDVGSVVLSCGASYPFPSQQQQQQQNSSANTNRTQTQLKS